MGIGVAARAAWLSRLAVLACGFAAVTLIGFPDRRLPPASSPVAILDLPARWDSGWYVGLASSGYTWDGAVGRFENLAFFPAFPLTLGVVARGLGATTEAAWHWTGVVLSTTLFSIALAVLWSIARSYTDEAGANWTVWLCATMPFSLFFGLAYTESLFLLGTAATTRAYTQRAYGAALAAGALVGLTRPNGAALTAVLAVLWLERWRRPPDDAVSRHDTVLAGVALCGPLLGTLVYSAFVFGLTGDALTWARAQEGWGRPLQNPVLALARPLTGVLVHPLDTLAAPFDAMNAVAGLVALALAVPIARRFGAAFGVMTVMGVVLPLAAGGVASLGRYTSVLFPVPLWLATTLPRAALPWCAALGLVGQAIVAAMFFTWRPLY